MELFDGYNQVILKNLDFFALVKNVYNYLTFFVFYLWIPIFYLLILKFKGQNIKFRSLFEKKDIINYFAILIIFASSIAPYLLTNKSNDLFFFTEYMDRHAFLLASEFWYIFYYFI